MQGRTPRPKPRLRWEDMILKDLETSGLSLKEAADGTRDRDGLRQIMVVSCNYNADGC